MKRKYKASNLFVGKINVNLNIFSILAILLTIILGISINGLIKILLQLMLCTKL